MTRFRWTYHRMVQWTMLGRQLRRLGLAALASMASRERLSPTTRRLALRSLARDVRGQPTADALVHFSFSSREPFRRASGTDDHMPFYMPGRLATSFAADLAADAGTPCGAHLLGADLSCSACRIAIAARRDKVPATAARVASILKEQRRAPLTAAADALAVPLSAAIRGVKLGDHDCWDRLAASVAALTANLPTAAQRAALEVCELMVIDARTRLDAAQAL